MFDVPRSVSMRLPKKGEKASEPQEENVAMFKLTFLLSEHWDKVTIVIEKCLHDFHFEAKDEELIMVTGENDKLKALVTNLKAKLEATVQTKGQAESITYAKRVSDIVRMFTRKFPYEDLDFLSKAPQAVRESLESDFENDEGEKVDQGNESEAVKQVLMMPL
ncbi:hypothetical protein OWV82_003826 [Melia azedarach]|uniref:Uncharacterized protein n=1 Tax=Melia azedarach TaxID=155640 RepID=A0ACC1YQK4_MELAZ|nr:hypothetical protein OWV82_003826 [Melia azedarach]